MYIIYLHRKCDWNKKSLCHLKPGIFLRIRCNILNQTSRTWHTGPRDRITTDGQVYLYSSSTLYLHPEMILTVQRSCKINNFRLKGIQIGHISIYIKNNLIYIKYQWIGSKLFLSPIFSYPFISRCLSQCREPLIGFQLGHFLFHKICH